MIIAVQRAAPEHAEIVALLGRITFQETFGYLFSEHRGDLRAYLDRTFALEKIRRSLGLDQNRYWLGLVNRLPVAYAKLKFPSATDLLPQPNVGQLQKIYVLHEFMGQGIGKPLLKAVLDDARSRAMTAIWLDVLQQNSRAIQFYERHGFATLGSDRFTIGAKTFKFHLMALHNLAA